MTATPFTKLLIANRGEIAVRVIRTAKAMGYRTVAIYSAVDAAAAHVLAADEAVGIGGLLPAESYLDIGKILAAAQASGADAVHPGYGFLAENADFASGCREAGLVFVGPSPEAIRAMGDKAEAKRLMQQAGVPCIPGYQGSDQSEDRLFKEAEAIGWPVMIKAVAGGGGRGMRFVTSEDAFHAALVSARSEASTAFGNADMLLERAIADPRHVEIQVFADRYGNAIHLGERDCSVQRRHQKVIEESPSPAVNSALRERMGKAAVEAALSIGYEGAGTFEFLLAGSDDFYFMEMNTRLQVEHPVTEAITGLDLVELQLRIAAGEALPLEQDEVRFSGHAMEVRLCAEDPENGFAPQSGVLRIWRAPESLRTDHALESGLEISPYYDSMIAKLISHGETRDEARRKLIAGLNETLVLGIATNRMFLARALVHPLFASGGATTAFVETAGASLLSSSDGHSAAFAVAAALLQCTTKPLFATAPSLVPHEPMGMRIECAGVTEKVVIQRSRGRRFTVTIGDMQHEVAIGDMSKEEASIECDGVRSTVWWVTDDGQLLLQYHGEAYIIRDTSLVGDGNCNGASVGDGKIRTVMTGRLVALHAAVGDHVKVGQGIFTVEAMKTEQVHATLVAGVVTALHAATGDQISNGRVIAEITPA